MAKKDSVKKEKSVSKKVTKEKAMKKPKSKRVTRTTGNKLIVEHKLVPMHTKLSEKEAKALLEFHNVTIKELPKIYIDDPAIRHLDVKENDIIKIIRQSPTAGKIVFYRGVIDE
ncbi:MAG: DNA-directed RNA polymerase subunit H [Candidatus Woesearchaeota archaeon]|jgi:DNA-directed RNA polymerase subunit H